MTLKTFRDERVNSDKVNYHREVLSERKPHTVRKYNSLYCTNRMSLRSCSMLKGTVYIHESHGSYWNVIEGSGKLWKAIEGDRRE